MTQASVAPESAFRREWGYGWGTKAFLVPAAITAASVAGAWLAWQQGARGLVVLVLALAPLLVLPVALRLPPWRKRCTSLTCVQCGAEPAWKDRAVGLPVEPDVLREGARSPLVAALARADWSALETAKPRATIQSWVRLPALFLSLGACPRCDSGCLVSIEVHGMDEKGVMHLGSVLSAEIAREDEQRLLAIARERGLMTYGHE